MKLLPTILIVSVILIAGCTSQTQSSGGYSSLQNVPATNEGQLAPPGNAVGDKAPDFNLTTTDGRTLRLSELKGKPVVLYFMATWCPFCKEEYGEISKAYPQYGYKVDLVSVSLDLNENAAVLEKYRVDNNRPGMFAPGNQHVLENYNVLYTTTKYAIGKNGVIVYKRVGEMDAGSWKTMLEALS